MMPAGEAKPEAVGPDLLGDAGTGEIGAVLSLGDRRAPLILFKLRFPAAEHWCSEAIHWFSRRRGYRKGTLRFVPEGLPLSGANNLAEAA
jgi:hypothetical protein